MNLPFPLDGTVSQWFPVSPWQFLTSFFWFLSLSAQRKSTSGCTKVRLNQEFITFPRLSIVFFSLLSAQSATMFVFLLCFYRKNPIRSDLKWLLGLFFFFLSVTLYSWTTPFCSSSGGGCQETMMAVPLSPLSVTVTLRGGALGAGRVRQRKTKTHVCAWNMYFLYIHIQFSSASNVQFSCHDLPLCETKADVRTND